MTHEEQMKAQALADKIQDLKQAIHKSWIAWAKSDCPHVMSATKSRCPDCWANRIEEIGL